jgi:hypothetical protein
MVYRVGSNWWKKASGCVEPQATGDTGGCRIFDGEKEAKLVRWLV